MNIKKHLKLLSVIFISLYSLIIFGPSTYAEGIYGKVVNEKKQKLVEGIELIEENHLQSSSPRAIQMLSVDLSKPNTSLELYHPNVLGTLQTTSQQARANSFTDHHVFGAINAGFVPMNMLVKDNQILNYGVRSPNLNGPVHHRAAFGLDRSGSPVVGDIIPDVSINYSGKKHALDSINGTRETGHVVLYTPSHSHSTTATNQWGTEFIIHTENSNTQAFGFGSAVKGVVQAIHTSGDSKIPSNGFVLSVQGGQLPDKYKDLKVGTEVTVSAVINDPWKDAQFILASGPTLLKNGQVSISMNTSSDFSRLRHPRSAVGMSKDGKNVYFITIDGRQSNYSIGSSLTDFAQYLKSKGIYHAINLDGGGSTTLVARSPYTLQLGVVNKPSDGSERRVPTTLHAVSKKLTSPVTEPVLTIHTFDQTGDWKVEEVNSKTSISTTSSYEPVRQGSGALKLNYLYANTDATSASYAKATQPIALKGEPKELGVWAFGDGREHWLRGTVLDANGKEHVVNFTNMNQFNWQGWRYVRAEVPSDVVYPIRFNKLYIAQPTVSKKGAGTVYFDQLEAIYQSSYSVDRFKDVHNKHWALKEIISLNDQGTINGFSDGSFKPDTPITREQTALMIARELGLDQTGVTSFNDVERDSFYEGAISAVEKAGIMTGRKEGSFSPKSYLKRAEMAAILTRAYQLQGTVTNAFPDVDIENWAYEEISHLKSNNISNGFNDGTFRPDSNTTRAEFSVFLYRVQ